MRHISDEKIPNNVDLSSDRRLQRALETGARTHDPSSLVKSARTGPSRQDEGEF